MQLTHRIAPGALVCEPMTPRWLVLKSVHRTQVLSRFSHVRLFATLWTVVCQAPLSMGFSRQNYQGGLPCLPSGDLSYREINPFLTSSALADRFCTTSATCGYKRRSNSCLRKNSMSFDRNVTILFLSGT